MILYSWFRTPYTIILTVGYFSHGSIPSSAFILVSYHLSQEGFIVDWFQPIYPCCFPTLPPQLLPLPLYVLPQFYTSTLPAATAVTHYRLQPHYLNMFDLLNALSGRLALYSLRCIAVPIVPQAPLGERSVWFALYIPYLAAV